MHELDPHANYTNSTDSFYGDQTETTMHEEIGSLVTKIKFYTTLFGIFANLVCICVFAQKSLLLKKINWYLLILALADFLFCTILFEHYFIISTNKSRSLYDMSRLTCYMMDYTIVNTTDTFTVYLMLVLSVDRLYAIMRPLESKHSMTNRFFKRITLIGYFFILLIKSPDLLLNQRVYNARHSHAEPKNEQTAIVTIDETESLFDAMNSSIDDVLKNNLNDLGK
jgi:hypothetical protein